MPGSAQVYTAHERPQPRLRWDRGVLKRVATTVIEQIADPTLPTIGALRNALTAQRPTTNATMLSLSVDREHGRSRVELALDAEDASDPALLAATAAQVLHRAFGRALGALRVDVYRCARGGREAITLVATHGDCSADEARPGA
jgi:hypothetical protein